MNVAQIFAIYKLIPSLSLGRGVIQALMGMLIPLGMMAAVRLFGLVDELRKLFYFVSAILILIGIFATRWNVVIGGQMFSKSFRGLTAYTMDIMGLEGFLMTLLLLLSLPIVVLAISIKIPPPWEQETTVTIGKASV